MAITAKYSLNGNSTDGLWLNNWTDFSMSYVPGKTNSSASFNWSSSYITTGSIVTTTTFTISMMVNTTTSSGTTYAFLSKRDSNTNGIFVFWLQSSKIVFWDYNGSSFGFSPGGTSIWTVNNGRRRHIAFVRSWTSGTYYIDWVASWTKTAASNITPNSNTIKLWRDSVDNVYFTWWIDELVFDNSALTAWNIKTQYAFYNWFM